MSIHAYARELRRGILCMAGLSTTNGAAFREKQSSEIAKMPIAFMRK